MCNIRNSFYAALCFVLCSVLVYAIASNKPEPELQVLQLEDIITNQQDLSVLHSLGVKGFVCFKEKGSDRVVCAKKGTPQGG